MPGEDQLRADEAPATAKMRGLGLVMPAFNAANTLAATVARIPVDALMGAGLVPRLFVVDDGSTDTTAAEVARLAGDAPLPVQLLRHDPNRGYGAAQKTGWGASLAAGNSLHVLLHSDGQYAPEELPRMIAPLLDDTAQVVIGSKFLGGKVLRQGMPLARMLGIRLLDALENRVFGLQGLEYHSGYMGYASAVLEAIPLQRLTDRFHFDGEMVLSAAHLGFAITRVPIATRYGDDTSSLAPLPYLADVIGAMGRYRRGRLWFQLSAD